MTRSILTKSPPQMKPIHCCQDTYNFRVCLYPCRVPMRGLDQTSVFTYLQLWINSCQSSFTELQSKPLLSWYKGLEGPFLPSVPWGDRNNPQLSTYLQHSIRIHSVLTQSLQNADKPVHFSPGTIFQNLFWPSAMLGEPKLSTAHILTAQHQVLCPLQSKRNLLRPRF